MLRIMSYKIYRMHFMTKKLTYTFNVSPNEKVQEKNYKILCNQSLLDFNFVNELVYSFYLH